LPPQAALGAGSRTAAETATIVHGSGGSLRKPGLKEEWPGQPGHSSKKIRVARLSPFRFGESQAGKRQKPAPLTFPPEAFQVLDQPLALAQRLLIAPSRQSLIAPRAARR